MPRLLQGRVLPLTKLIQKSQLPISWLKKQCILLGKELLEANKYQFTSTTACPFYRIVKCPDSSNHHEERDTCTFLNQRMQSLPRKCFEFFLPNDWNGFHESWISGQCMNTPHWVTLSPRRVNRTTASWLLLFWNSESGTLHYFCEIGFVQNTTSYATKRKQYVQNSWLSYLL